MGLAAAAGALPIVLTDDEGRFAVTALAAGQYTVTVSKPGYLKTGSTNPIQLTDAAAVDDVEIRVSRSAAISGRVVDDLGDPVVGTTVIAEEAGRGLVAQTARGSSNVAPAGRAQTDDLGEYRIGGLPAGSFLVSSMGRAMPPIGPQGADSIGEIFVTVNGVVRVTPTFDGLAFQLPASLPGRYYYGGVQRAADASPITVGAGDERTAVDIVLPSNPTFPRSGAAAASRRNPATGVLRGLTLRSDGRALGQASVGVESLDQVFHGAVTSDSEGVYEFQELPAGAYRLYASKTGFDYIEFAQRAAFERGQPVRVNAGELRDRADLSLPRLGAIAGRLVDQYSDPVEGARVRVLQLTFSAGRRQLVDVPGVQPGKTNDAGRYRIYGLRTGQYFVSAVVGQVDVARPMADLPGYAPTYYPGTPNPGEARPIAVGWAQNVDSGDLPLSQVRTARVTGSAFSSQGDPIRGGLLLVASQRSEAVAPMRVGALIYPDGTFEFPNVAPGEYVIQAFRARITRSTEAEFGMQFVIVNGSDVTRVVVRTSPGSTIAGRVTFDSAETPNPREFELSPVPVDADTSPFMAGPLGQAEIENDWTFTLAGISGSRRLRLTHAPSGWALKAIYANGIDVTDTALPFGTADQSLRGIEVVLTNRLAEVSGRVPDARACAITDCDVTVFGTNREQWYPDSRFVKRVTPTRDGAFSIRGLPSGEYFVAAVGRRQSSTEKNDEWQAPELLDALARQASRVGLTEGQRVSASPTLLVK